MPNAQPSASSFCKAGSPICRSHCPLCPCPSHRSQLTRKRREQELEENDDELQHLRICLKAVEIQMPPHPDKELQRCIAAFKDDYQALKHKRAHRATITSATGFDSSSESPGTGSPTQ